MRIDERIEECVREAFAAAIAKEGDRMVAALKPLSEEDARTGIGYAVFVCGHVINALFPDGPTHDDLLAMAQRVVDSERGWVNLGEAGNVANFLGAAAQGDTTFPDVNKEDVIGYAFVCGAYLLTSYRRDGQTWWTHLDEVWEAAQSVPD